MKLTKKFYLIIPIVICGITLTAVYATGTVETFTAPWQLQDSSNSQTRMYVDNSGNVGIGTVSPSYALDVSGQIHTGGSSPKIVLDNGGDVAWPNGASNHGIDFGFGSTIMRQASDGHVKYTAQNGVHEFSGNVGIGTASPSARLQLVTPGGGNLYVSDYGCGAYGGIGGNPTLTSCTNYALLTGGTDTFINRPSGNTIKFREANGDQVTIASGGNVGIGTTTPAQKLEVNGGIQADGNLTTSSTNKEFKISAPSGVPICIGSGC